MQLPHRYGKYVLLNKIASGGMAEIYRAKSTGAEGFEREIAIKRILPHFTEDEQFVKMFIDEARIAAKLQHTNIVQVFDFDNTEGSYYIAMELIEGKDWKRIQKRGKEIDRPMTVNQCVYVMVEVLKGLHFAHTRIHKNKPLNIIHRDISPQNVMISYQGEVKLMDFGIAKAASRLTETRAGVAKGKTAYMSPEQAAGKGVDVTTDVFACGIVLWEVLTGQVLFEADSDFQTLMNIMEVEIPPPSKYNRNIDKRLDRIVLKALERNKDARYQTAGDFLKDLNAFFFSVVSDIEEIDLPAYMQELFADDIQAMIEMQASERKVADMEMAPSDAAPKKAAFDRESQEVTQPKGEQAELDETQPSSQSSSPAESMQESEEDDSDIYSTCEQLIAHLEEHLKSFHLELSNIELDKHPYHCPSLIDLKSQKIHVLLYGDTIHLGRERENNSIILRAWGLSREESQRKSRTISRKYAMIDFQDQNCMIHAIAGGLEVNSRVLSKGQAVALIPYDRLGFSGVLTFKYLDEIRDSETNEILFARISRTDDLQSYLDYIICRGPIVIGGDSASHLFSPKISGDHSFTLEIANASPPLVNLYANDDVSKLIWVDQDGNERQESDAQLGSEEIFFYHGCPFMLSDLVLCDR